MAVATLNGHRETVEQRLLSKRERHKALGKWAGAGGPLQRKTANSENTGDVGGFLVPPELSIGIDAYVSERCFFRRYGAWVQPMNSLEMNVPIVDFTASHTTGDTPIFGGFGMLPVASQGTAATEDEPLFANNLLRARDIAAYALVSNQMVEDGGEPLGAYLENIFQRAVLWFTQKEFFYGTGVTKPLGVGNPGNPGAALVTRSVASKVRDADVASMMGLLLPACYPNAIWACSPSVVPQLPGLSGYQPNVFTEYAGNGGGASLCGALFGRPLAVTESLPLLGTQGDLILFDPTLYIIGERSLTIDASQFYNGAYLNYQTAYVIWWRGDGQPAVKGTFTLGDGTTGAGCYVQLV